MNTTLAAKAANLVTIVIGVAFLGMITVGIAQPVQAKAAVTTTVAR